ncbi:AraC family transcriptional regulator [Oscillospiraceae bacterium OttesenSCG-928-F05]|nr:AraC family transcriptional regulator [Oscillospiraceae bacterium OttesenSCG-928-F05]
MLEKYIFPNHGNTDIHMYKCGYEDCRSGHTWGPAVRDHYLVHYVHTGCGVFHIGDKSYRLSAGDGFFIPPDTVAHYSADENDPWSYSWIGFHGLKAEKYMFSAGLSAKNPRFAYTRDDRMKTYFKKMITASSADRVGDMRALGYFYLIISLLTEVGGPSPESDGKGRSELYVKKAVEYIRTHYTHGMRIGDMAAYLGLNRSYLYDLFMTYLRMSPQQFLIRFRIEKACDLMRRSQLSISDISRSVGYDDPFLFSKVFKKVTGMPPRAYRKTLDAASPPQELL